MTLRRCRSGLGGFRVRHVRLDINDAAAVREVTVVGVDVEQACPACGVLTSAVHSRRTRRVKDLPHGRRPLRLWWDQRRFACRERLCPRRTFAERSEQIGTGRRVTLRLREQLEQAVSASTRAVSDVARECGVAWSTVHAALVEVAARVLGPAVPGADAGGG